MESKVNEDSVTSNSSNDMAKDLTKGDEPFYSDAAEYWAKVEPTDDGMLGGLGRLSRIDIQNSEKLLKTLFKLEDAPEASYVLDCGSGIGRISKNLLQRFFAKVDLVDQDEKFIQEARRNFEGNEKIGNIVCCGLHKFTPEPDKYDVIWMQWVLNHMTDDDLIEFLQRCKPALRVNGILVVKENCTRGNSVEHDPVDSSTTRAFQMFLDIFKKAGYKVITNVKQKNFPKELFPVWSFALRPLEA